MYIMNKGDCFNSAKYKIYILLPTCTRLYCVRCYQARRNCVWCFAMVGTEIDIYGNDDDMTIKLMMTSTYPFMITVHD